MELTLLDATLREGEQRSGRSYSVEQKVAAAEALSDLGVEIIQAGFPVAEDDFGEVCARLDVDAKIVGLARAIPGDIDAAAEAGVDIVEVSAPTSDRQRSELLGVSREELTEKIETTLEYASDTGLEVHFAAMDGFRSDPAFLSELLDVVDAPYFGIADTVGGRTPGEVTEFFGEIDGDLSRVSVHFHRDLGVGTANVLAAADCGVGKADVTVGGIGERVGNVALEEVVVAGSVRPDPISFGVDLDELIPNSLEVLDILDEDVPANKPVLGELAFEHESGMHTAAMLDDPSTFEAFDPASFGGTRRLLFGLSSGRGAARRLLERAGVDDPSDERVAGLLDRLHGLDEHVSLERAVEMASETASA